MHSAVDETRGLEPRDGGAAAEPPAATDLPAPPEPLAPSERAPTAAIPATHEASRTDETSRIEPAPEPVAPSKEVALRDKDVPPAIASAPSLAPAPLIPLIPAPEPKAPPRPSAPQVVVAPLPGAGASRGEGVRAVRFDAGYYYGRARSARHLAVELTESWAEHGVNLVYFYAYNRVYGARYRTRYPGNIMEDFGRLDLLREVICEGHRRDIKVIAWFQGLQHKQVWEAHPDWRQKTRDGADHKPDRDSYFLCAHNPDVMKWWLGFLDDLLSRYPDLDGIDLAEFQVDLWGDNACYCEHCRAQFAQVHPGETTPGPEWRQHRAEGLTRVLLAGSRLAHHYGREAHVTAVFTARRDGKLMSSAQLRDAIGFDLEAVLSSSDRPEVIQAELIWQQWAAAYGDGETFTPEWTREATRQAKRMVGGRARLMAHVEVTDFGSGDLDGLGLAHTIAAAMAAEPYGVDIYDAHQLERTDDATRYLQMAWLGATE